MSLVWGLIIGFVIGIVAMYFITRTDEKQKGQGKGKGKKEE